MTFLALRPDALSPRLIIVATIAIYLLGVALRLVWLARVGWHTPDLHWQGVPLLTSADGYWFAAGAGDLLSGAWADNPRLPLATDHALVALAALVTRITPWSLDAIILYLPALLGPLVALPLVALGRALSLARVGLVAALAAVVAPAFLARSSAGYFDTDPLALAVPFVVLVYLVRLFVHDRARDALWAALWLAAYPWLYNQGSALGLALATTAALAILTTRRAAPWRNHALALLVASQLPLPWPVARPALVLALHLGLVALRPRLPTIPPRLLHVAFIAVAAFVLARVGPLIVAKITYFLGLDGAADAAGVTFGDSADFVAETRRQPFGELGDRLAGSPVLLVIELIGCALLVAHRRVLLLALPIALLGAFAALGGMRFGIYAVPFLGLGLAYLLAWLTDRAWFAVRPRTSGVALALAAALALTPATLRARVMFTRPPLVRAEVEALDHLRQHASPEATTLAWWDDGYPILYFARTRTIVDGGRREADVSLIAEILLAPSAHASANLARHTITTRDGGLPADWAIAPTLFERARAETGLGLDGWLGSLAAPGHRVAAPAAPVYLYLPLRLLAIVPVIAALRPHAPGSAAEPFTFRLHNDVRVDGGTIHLATGSVDATNLIITEAGAHRPLRTIYSLRGHGPALELRTRTRHPDAPTSGIYLHDPAIFIELDERALATSLVQLLVFERAEAGTFEPVFSNAAARIFRVSP